MDETIKIGKNFTLADVQFNEIAVRLGMSNEVVDDHVISNARRLAKNVLDPLIEQFGHVFITSWYRNQNLEREYSRNTFARWCIDNRLPIRDEAWQQYIDQKQHYTGCAVTIRAKDNDELFDYIKDNLAFDTLMHKNHWISVSFTQNNQKRAIGR